MPKLVLRHKTLALATAWCYAFGKWHVAEVAPLRIKKHGRNQKSVFRRGLDILRQVFSGCAAQYPRFCRKAYDLIKPKLHALLSGRLKLFVYDGL